MQQAQSLLEKLPNTTQIDQRLQQAILMGLQKNQFQIEHVATQLNLSVRQLQRHLQQQGSTYQQRMQEVRCMMAEEFLRDPTFKFARNCATAGLFRTECISTCF